MERWRGQGLLYRTMQQCERLQQSPEYAAATTTVLRNGTNPGFDDGMSYTVDAAARAALTAAIADAATGSPDSVLATVVSPDAPAVASTVDCGGIVIVIVAWAALIIIVADVATRSFAADLAAVASSHALATASTNSGGIAMAA